MDVGNYTEILIRLTYLISNANKKTLLLYIPLLYYIDKTIIKNISRKRLLKRPDYKYKMHSYNTYSVNITLYRFNIP